MDLHRNSMVIGVLAGFLGLAQTVHAAEAPAAVHDEIVALAQSLMDAIGEGKADVWQRVLADDAMIVDEFGRIQGKKEAVASIAPLPKGFSGSIELRDPQVRVFGNTAIVRSEEYERETVFGQQLTVRYIGVMSFVKTDGAWKLIASEDVTLPTPPPKLAVVDLPLVDYPGTYSYGPDRAFIVSTKDGELGYVTKPGRPFIALEPIAKDVFMGSDDERNLLVFRRDANDRVIELIERRKFNDLHLRRGTTPSGD